MVKLGPSCHKRLDIGFLQRKQVGVFVCLFNVNEFFVYNCNEDIHKNEKSKHLVQNEENYRYCLVYLVVVVHDDVPVFSGRASDESRKTKVKGAEIYLAVDFIIAVVKGPKEIHACDGKDENEKYKDHHRVLDVVISHVESLKHALQVFTCFYHPKKPCHSYDSKDSEVERQPRGHFLIDRQYRYDNDKEIKLVPLYKKVEPWSISCELKNALYRKHIQKHVVNLVQYFFVCLARITVVYAHKYCVQDYHN